MNALHRQHSLAELEALYYPGQKNRYSRDIHEIDPQCDHVISRDIDFDLQRELATRSYRESCRGRTEARYRTISHDRTVDQPHEFLGCNDFFGQGSIKTCTVLTTPMDHWWSKTMTPPADKHILSGGNLKWISKSYKHINAYLWFSKSVHHIAIER